MRARSPIMHLVLAGIATTAVGSAALAQAHMPSGYGVQRYTPQDFHMPEGSGCAGDIARWQAIQGNDYASGNVNLRIYNQIQTEIVQAATLCQEGRDVEARKLIAGSRARHGYPRQ